MTLKDYLEKENAVQVLLSIDLGNSRTVMTVTDQVNEHAHPVITYTDIPLKWEVDTYKGKPPIYGPVPSLVSCVNMSGNDSFVRVGEHSQTNIRNLNTIGEKSISSPKRYYYDMTKPKQGWLASITEDGNFAGNDFLKGDFAKALAARYGCSSASEMPRAGMLGGLVVELYEQADRFVNDDSFKIKTKDRRNRFIADVHITYPTAFSNEEKDRYKLQVKKALDVYFALNYTVEEVPTRPRVNVHSKADEAIAVLGYYAETEIKRAGANTRSWLATIGREVYGKQYATRIAVIDIGGGTTDLTIADVKTYRTPTEAIVHQIYLDGVNRAGDDVLVEIIQAWLFPRFMQAVLQRKANVTPEQFKEKYNRYVDDKKGIIETLRVAALQALMALDKDDNSLKEINLATGWSYNNKEEIKNLTKIIDTGWDVNLDEITIRMTPDDKEKILTCLRNVLGAVVEAMARKVAAYDCDRLVFSGKLMELRAIRKFVQGYIALPPWAVLSVTDLMEKGQDVKLATALGGAQAALQTMQVTNATSHLWFMLGEDLEDGYVWGQTTNINVPMLRISNELKTECMIEADGCVRITFTGATAYLLRQRKGKTGVVAVTHEIRKRDPRLYIDGGASVRVKVTGERVELVGAEGRADGRPLTRDDIAFCVHGFSGGKHWLDDGRIA